MEEAKDDALEKEQEPVDTSTTAAPQSHADVLLLLEENKSLKKENKELRILLRLRRLRRHEEFSAFMEEVHLDLDETHFAELLPIIKLHEKRILKMQKFEDFYSSG